MDETNISQKDIHHERKIEKHKLDDIKDMEDENEMMVMICCRR